MSAAVALSVAIHFFLIYGFSLPADSGPGGRTTVIHARLAPPSSIGPLRAKTSERDGSTVPVRSAPVEPPATAQSALPEPDAVPGPKEVRSDLEAVAANGGEGTKLNIPDPVHYPAKDLDVYPQALKPLSPVYPEAARDAQVSGFVTLQVLIDESGRVVGTSVVDTAPDGVFEQAALEALGKAAFYPARKDGHSVRSTILIKVEFDPADIAQ